MTKETPRGMWGALRPAIRRTNAEELLQARQAERQANRQAVEPAPNTGAFGRIAADVPSVAEEPDLPTGSVPVVPARSKLREQGVGSRVRTRTNVSTGFVPLVRDSPEHPQNPTLSDLNRETMQRAAEAEATASAPQPPPVHPPRMHPPRRRVSPPLRPQPPRVTAVASTVLKPPAPARIRPLPTPTRRFPPSHPHPRQQNAPRPVRMPCKISRAC